MNNTELSIIIPVYNSEKYIARCLGSVLRQQDSNKYEIIVVDDGSTDNTGKIIDNFSQKYPNITVIHQENMGVSMARNNGIDASHGKYVTFVDADDIVGLNRRAFKSIYQKPNTKRPSTPNCTKTIFCGGTPKFLPSYCFTDTYFINMLLLTHDDCDDTDVVLGGKIGIWKDGGTIDTLLFNNGIEYIHDINDKFYNDEKINLINHAIQRESANFALYRREMLDKHNLRFVPKMDFNEDILFCMLAVLFSNKIMTHPDVTYMYNIHSGTLSDQNTNGIKYKKQLKIAMIRQFSTLLYEMSKMPNLDITFNHFMRTQAWNGSAFLGHHDFPPHKCCICNRETCTNCPTGNDFVQKLPSIIDKHKPR